MYSKHTFKMIKMIENVKTLSEKNDRGKIVNFQIKNPYSLVEEFEKAFFLQGGH